MMIERNLGNLERVFRLALGIALAVWALMQPTLNVIEIFSLVVALMLIGNGIFSRCYLWYILDLNTTNEQQPDTARS